MSSSHTHAAARSALLLAARCFLAGALGVLAASDALIGQTAGRPARTTVVQYIGSLGMGASELRGVERGQVVVRLLKTEDNRDVAVVGVTRVGASRAAVVARALGVRGVVVTSASRFGVFGDPAAGGDVRGVAFDRSEYKGLRNCHPRDCNFKLSASEMSAFVTNVAWSSPNAKAQADDLMRGQLLRLVADYRRRGDSAMPTYDDGHGVRSAEAFAAVLTQSRRPLGEHAPDLLRYLTTYPAGRPDGVHDFMYWSEERRSRMRPTLTVNHVVAYAPANGPAFIARKQVYASHYLDAALEVLAVIDADVPGAAYLVTVRRFRFDHLPGGILNVRGRVRSQLTEVTRADLTRERAAIERQSVAARR